MLSYGFLAKRKGFRSPGVSDIYYISGEWSKNIIFVVKKRFCHQQHGNNFAIAYKIPNMPHTWISLCFSLFMIYFFLYYIFFNAPSTSGGLLLEWMEFTCKA